MSQIRQNNLETKTVSFTSKTSDEEWGNHNIVTMGLTGQSVLARQQTVKEAIRFLKSHELLASENWGVTVTAMRFANRLKRRVQRKRRIGPVVRKSILKARRTSLLNASPHDTDEHKKNFRFSVTEDNGITKYLDEDLRKSSSDESSFSEEELNMMMQRAESAHASRSTRESIKQAVMVLKRSKSAGFSLKTRSRSRSKSPNVKRSPSRSGFRNRRKPKSILGKNVRKTVRSSSKSKSVSPTDSKWVSNAPLPKYKPQKKVRKSLGAKKKRHSKSKRIAHVMMEVIFPNFKTHVAMHPTTTVKQVLKRLNKKFEDSRLKILSNGEEIQDATWALSELSLPIVVRGRRMSNPDIIVFSDTEGSSDEEEEQTPSGPRPSIATDDSSSRGASLLMPPVTPTMSICSSGSETSGNEASEDEDDVVSSPTRPSLHRQRRASVKPAADGETTGKELSRTAPVIPCPKARKSRSRFVAKATQPRQLKKVSLAAPKRSMSASPQRTSIKKVLEVPTLMDVASDVPASPVTPTLPSPDALGQIHTKLLEKTPGKIAKREIHFRSAGLRKGWYKVTGSKGCVVRSSQDLKSNLVARVPKKTMLHVVDIRGNRMRIDKPHFGWVSFQSKSGGKILKYDSQPLELDEKRVEKKVEKKKASSTDKVATFIDEANEEMLRSCIRQLYVNKPSLLEKIVGRVYMSQCNDI